MRSGAPHPLPKTSPAVELRIRGRVQGVGFRPTVWRAAHDLGIRGEVLNDASGVVIRVDGDCASSLLDGIARALPPLAQIDRIEQQNYAGNLPADFRIVESIGGAPHTQIAPDAAICSECARELLDADSRRFRYPFINCTCCGPRLSIVRAIPYDRGATTMAGFALCERCDTEYRDPRDRRFHAEPIACAACGPAAILVELNPATTVCRDTARDDVALAAKLIGQGEIVAVKGLGGYHLACDARNAETVCRLRRLKRRDSKPFALMARDLGLIRRYCTVDAEEERQLTSVQGPIVLLPAHGGEGLPSAVAPGLKTFGFMLPTTPLHLLLVADIEYPLIMTSGNISDEPPIIDDDEAREKLAQIAGYALRHNREIANRLDDSVVRIIAGKSRVMRRARGFAPAPLKLPSGFENGPEVLALGGELKSTFCLVKDGHAILSQHQGDLENTATFDDFRKNLAFFSEVFDHAPVAIVVDRHPEYLSTKWGRSAAQKSGLRLVTVQHHHAHVGACLAENAYPLGAPPVMGIVLDGLGFGDDGTIWGGEFLLADYCGFERLARLKPVPMPGGAAAAREPWRNLYAHLVAALGRNAESPADGAPNVGQYLRTKPLALLDVMMASGLNTPTGSSCGRLFDAVAAALDICRDQQTYEGEAAARLEALAEAATLTGRCYRFDIARRADAAIIDIDPAPMWSALMCDLVDGVGYSDIALAFHEGLAQAIVETATRLAESGLSKPRFDTVALSGGCLQNRLLFESIALRMRNAGFAVFAHSEVPPNDGGLALGQAAIGSALICKEQTRKP